MNKINHIDPEQSEAEQDDASEEELELTGNDGFVKPPPEVLEEILRSKKQSPS